MTRLRELIEKAATAPLTEDERQELQRHFVGLAQREAHIVQIIRAEEAEEITGDNRFLCACGMRPPDMRDGHFALFATVENVVRSKAER